MSNKDHPQPSRRRLPWCGYSLAGAAAAIGIIVVGWYSFWPEEVPSAERLRAVACDPTQGRDARAEAVLKLFAHSVPINSTAEAIREAFADCDWAAEAQIKRLEFLSGDSASPVRFSTGTSLFAADLFPAKQKPIYRIYFKLSGECRSLEDAQRFFNPQAKPDPKVRLTELILDNWHKGKEEIIDSTGYRQHRMRAHP
jgi:hypothetical protein